jgi:hypothetical protein
MVYVWFIGIHFNFCLVILDIERTLHWLHGGRHYLQGSREGNVKQSLECIFVNCACSKINTK